MPYQPTDQYIDLASGFHVLELRNELGHKHLVQIAIGHDACPACGHATPKDNLDAIDPRAMVAEVMESLNQSQQAQLDYAQKHGIEVR